MTSLTIPPLSKHQSKMMIVSQETLRRQKRRKAPAQVFAPPPSRESGDQRPENNLQGCGCRIRPRGLLPLEASPDVIRPMYFKALHCPWPVACCKVYTLLPSKSLNTTNKTQPRQPSLWHSKNCLWLRQKHHHHLFTTRRFRPGAEDNQAMFACEAHHPALQVAREQQLPSILPTDIRMRLTSN